MPLVILPLASALNPPDQVRATVEAVSRPSTRTAWLPQAAPALYQPPPAHAPPPVETAVQLTADAKFGQVAIRVQPVDAEVVIDGEPWKGAPGAERLVVHLSAGTHRVEIRKDGFDSFVTAVEIRRGEVTVLNVSLARF